jgi:hypothetical protein
MLNRPSHVGRDGEERTIDRQHFTQGLRQIGGQAAPAPPCCGLLQARHDRLQQGWIGHAMEVREGALAQATRRKMPLRLPSLTEILDRPQTPQRRIEERQQVCNHHVVEKQLAIAMRRAVAQRAHVGLQHPHIFAAGNRLWPIRKVFT